MAKNSQSKVIYITNARLSFPHLIDPQRNTGDDGKERIAYNADFILEPSNPAWNEFMHVYQAMAQEGWDQYAQNAMTMIHGDHKKRCYGEGQEKVNQKTFEVYQGYQGMVYLSASRSTLPQVIDTIGNAIDATNTMAIQAELRKMYGGCYVNAAIKPWLQDNKHGKGVRADLVAVQFLRDGEAFGEGQIDASGMFGSTGNNDGDQPAAAGAELPPFLR